MFRTLTAFGRTFRKMMFPLSRIALVVLVWSNRHTVALWYRSLRDEVDANGFDPGRLRHLVRGLWTIAADRSTSNTEAIRTISLGDDQFVVEAREDWPLLGRVESLLAPIPPYPTVATAA